MTRITERQLKTFIERINIAAGTPQTYAENGEIHVGHYHLENAYGGWKLVQTVNKSGGIRDVLQGGYMSKSKLYEFLQTYYAGLTAQAK
jgi:hypothetical protein